jgi:3-oxoacyl-[acyl-carrier-protein] synthase II
VRRLDFAHPLVRSSVAAGVPTGVFDPESVMTRADVERLPRLVPMALAACREAMEHAGLTAGVIDQGGRARRIGLVLGTGAGGIDFTLDQAQAAYGGAGAARASLWTITNATHGNLAGELSIRLGLKGPSWCVSTGCASSSDAAGMALMALRAGMVDAMVVVGADAHVRWETLHGMELLKVISTRACADDREAAAASRPFDATRDGFVLGEGAWAVVLERDGAGDDRARRRARLCGYGATCDAYHRVRPDPDMAECARAMREAVEDAGWRVEDVDLLHYHGTATRINDAAETAAVKLAFGEHARRLRGSSVKGVIGHPQGASGLASLVASLCGLAGGFIPPTAHLSTPDPACDLDYTARAPGGLEAGREYRLIVNCLAFGAKNSVLAVSGRAGPL